MADAFFVFLGVLAVLGIFYGPWQSLCTDVARQLIFEQRERLFDLALEGKMDFSSYQYRTIRLKMESLVRFAHELTWPNYVYTGIVYPNVRKSSADSSILNIVNQIDDENVRFEVQSIVVKSYAVILLMMFAKSLVILIVWPMFLGLFIASRSIRALMVWVKSSILRHGAVVQAEAECV